MKTVTIISLVLVASLASILIVNQSDACSYNSARRKVSRLLNQHPNLIDEVKNGILPLNNNSNSRPNNSNNNQSNNNSNNNQRPGPVNIANLILKSDGKPAVDTDGSLILNDPSKAGQTVQDKNGNDILDADGATPLRFRA